MQLTSIEVAGDHSYRVTFSDASDASVRSFVFQMECKDDIDVLMWGDDFSEFCGYNTGPLRALFAAVLSFHTATQLTLLPSGGVRAR